MGRITFLVSVLALNAAILSAQEVASNDTFNILNFGAVADGVTINTEPIQAALDACYRGGGGTVFIPAGNFLTGTVVLKANTHLYIDAEAQLMASRNIEDYRTPLEDALKPVLIYANGATNIKISGPGTIYGNVRHAYEPLRSVDPFIAEFTENARSAGVEMSRYYIEPPIVGLILLSNCTTVAIQNVSLIDSPFWTLHLVRCSRASLTNLRIETSLEKGVNADGIDINSSTNVQVKGCTISTGDDAIAIKTRYSDSPSEDITVSECVLSSSSTALKLGTESFGDFRRIVFENCKVINSNRGLSIVVRDGGTVDGVVFRNIEVECLRRHFNWWGNADPIWIYLTKYYPESALGYIKNVRFENITATGMGTSRLESTEGQHIQNISFENVHLHLSRENEPDERVTHAVEAKFVRNLSLSNCSITWSDEQSSPRWQSALATYEVDSLAINAFTARQGLLNSTLPAIDFNETRNATVVNSLAVRGCQTFVNVRGSSSRNITLRANASGEARTTMLKVASDVIEPSTITLEP